MKILLVILLMMLAGHAVAQEFDSVGEILDSMKATEIQEAVEEEEISSDTPHNFHRMYMDEYRLAALRKKREFKYDDTDSTAAFTKPGRAKVSFKKFDATIFLWLMAALALFAVVLQLSGMNVRQLVIASKRRVQNEGDTEIENIHDIKYEQVIAEAIEEKNFSLAIRFMYLQSLKLLADKDFIKWLPNKTNWQYVYELQESNLKNCFKKMTSVFEYVGYGNMLLSEAQFESVQIIFSDFNKLMN